MVGDLLYVALVRTGDSLGNQNDTCDDLGEAFGDAWGALGRPLEAFDCFWISVGSIEGPWGYLGDLLMVLLASLCGPLDALARASR